MAMPGDFWTRWRVRAGYPLALVYIWLATPAAGAVALGAGVAVAGLIVRGAAAGYLRKGEALAMSGPYARTRNPLYFGSALLAAGFAVASLSWMAAALVAAYFLGFYPAVMRREEEDLRERYRREFDEYAAHVPLFWPRLSAFVTPAGSEARFSWAQYRRNREYQAALGFLFALALVVMRMFWRG
jgi:protein-S-isoprenylcysteine O-methyltransferase Ste14